jgi:hypothetical protein
MRGKQAKRLRRRAWILSPKKEATMVDRITRRIRYGYPSEKKADIIEWYTRYWAGDSPRRIYRGLKKSFCRIPRPMRARAIADLDKMRVRKA